eukprot:jgi/Bigna1/76269/fgenesh1_pg.40_\
MEGLTQPPTPETQEESQLFEESLPLPCFNIPKLRKRGMCVVSDLARAPSKNERSLDANGGDDTTDEEDEPPDENACLGHNTRKESGGQCRKKDGEHGISRTNQSVSERQKAPKTGPPRSSNHDELSQDALIKMLPLVTDSFIENAPLSQDFNYSQLLNCRSPSTPSLTPRSTQTPSSHLKQPKITSAALEQREQVMLNGEGIEEDMSSASPLLVERFDQSTALRTPKARMHGLGGDDTPSSTKNAPSSSHAHPFNTGPTASINSSYSSSSPSSLILERAKQHDGCSKSKQMNRQLKKDSSSRASGSSLILDSYDDGDDDIVPADSQWNMRVRRRRRRLQNKRASRSKEEGAPKSCSSGLSARNSDGDEMKKRRSSISSRSTCKTVRFSRSNLPSSCSKTVSEEAQRRSEKEQTAKMMVAEGGGGQKVQNPILTTDPKTTTTTTTTRTSFETLLIEDDAEECLPLPPSGSGGERYNKRRTRNNNKPIIRIDEEDPICDSSCSEDFGDERKRNGDGGKYRKRPGGQEEQVDEGEAEITEDELGSRSSSGTDDEIEDDSNAFKAAMMAAAAREEKEEAKHQLLPPPCSTSSCMSSSSESSCLDWLLNGRETKEEEEEEEEEEKRKKKRPPSPKRARSVSTGKEKKDASLSFSSSSSSSSFVIDDSKAPAFTMKLRTRETRWRVACRRILWASMGRSLERKDKGGGGTIDDRSNAHSGNGS